MCGKLWAEILLDLEMRGYKGQIVSTRHLGELHDEIENRHKQGQMDEEFYQESLSLFNFQLPNTLPNADTLIVVAVPQPQNGVVFSWNGKKYSFIIPPTYFHHPNEEVETLLTRIVVPSGFNVVSSVLPLKLLATRCGIGYYGKNNICYIPGMGSFHRLMAFYSDFPCHADTWQNAMMLPDCQNCSACLHHCPTSAITSERFLLHAERCITFHNERPVEIKFPSWINPTWHNSLVGCMHSQIVCPQNRDFLNWVEPRGEFSEEETAVLLTGTPLDQLPTKLSKKIEQLDLTGIFEVFPRNLGVLLNELAWNIRIKR
jgi:epoxyqueuosine reductase